MNFSSSGYYALVMTNDRGTPGPEVVASRIGPTAREAVVTSAQAGTDRPRKVGVTLPGGKDQEIVLYQLPEPRPQAPHVGAEAEWKCRKLNSLVGSNGRIVCRSESLLVDHRKKIRPGARRGSEDGGGSDGADGAVSDE